MSRAAMDLRYDPASHTTTLDGRDVPHVTTVLTAVRVTEDFDELGATLGARVAGDIALARDRGTAVHADCHAYDDGDLLWDTVDPRVRPYVEAWATCRENKGLVPLARERHVYHPLHHYCGILDGVMLHQGRTVLPDIKTGDPESAAGHLQTAAYEAAWLAQHPGERIDERWAIWLQPGARVPYRIVNYSARADAYMDFGKFLACLCVYHEQPARRRRVR